MKKDDDDFIELLLLFHIYTLEFFSPISDMAK